ncbi:TetR/AcrR family transcriptional regulator [Vibrio lentus]|uniref:HTH tetR-type domain-containing protein n=1 Tax=Vibrio lentus TaxID=136468 RepID=A0AA44W058_9VIBR|nr:TetR family transcriptional regulator [Vibrio lentus]MCB5361027.1 TetR/AcrR family transcriptional regulator [Vibrio lentus]MCB5451751.1 TetR/AcrR family transcriptional regulator [Vibrio lentus]MCB5462762.1 TetR/AcrR family transcriptional regulator [Vibrio lentus]MCC4792216.1 TetR/AcrR family transcriptional regulator [Vibrio lentus]MCC4850241.1 TetR/AcrR family transcriptional regulator [Vibrio lentus]
MARVSAEEIQRKRKMYDECILNLFLTEGWDAVTYDRIAKEMGITKSSLQRYYANKMQFAYALEGQVFQQATKLLDFTDRDSFLDSWKQSLNENQIFRECLHIIMTNALAPVSAAATTKAVTRLTGVLANNIGKVEAQDTVDLALGRSLISYMNNKL